MRRRITDVISADANNMRVELESLRFQLQGIIDQLDTLAKHIGRMGDTMRELHARGTKQEAER